jgi:RNA polymerase sigma factor (sigma-70 family)
MILSPSASPCDASADDAQLVTAVTDGDPAALRTLHDRYSSPARAVARRVLVDDYLAQDVVQDVFVTLWQHADRYDPGRGPFAAWLLRVTHHRAVDLIRREESIRRRLAHASRTSDEATAADRVDAAVSSTLDRERLHVALRHLPHPQRAVITLAYFHDLTQREIAERTGTPLGTVKTRTRAGPPPPPRPTERPARRRSARTLDGPPSPARSSPEVSGPGRGRLRHRSRGGARARRGGARVVADPVMDRDGHSRWHCSRTAA